MGVQCSFPRRMLRSLLLWVTLLALSPLVAAYWDGVNDMPPSGRSDVDSDDDGLSDAEDDEDDNDDGIDNDDDDDDDNDGVPDKEEDDDGDGIDNEEDHDDDGDGIEDEDDLSHEL